VLKPSASKGVIYARFVFVPVIALRKEPSRSSSLLTHVSSRELGFVSDRDLSEDTPGQPGASGCRPLAPPSP